MAEISILPVILCGGSGTRLWPLSRMHAPKQFLRLFDQHSLLQHTLMRAAAIEGALAPLVICSAQYRFMVSDHLQEIGMTPSAILLEPSPRNTAPAIASAALWAQRHAPGARLLVLPSDHFIRDSEAFAYTVHTALCALPEEALLTFGITPTHPETNYGYVKAAQPIGASGLRRVERFVEKPPLEKALVMLAEKDWHWNSGMFGFTAQAALEALRAHAPAVLTAAENALAQPAVDGKTIWLGDAFDAAPSISFDHAVMEKAPQAALMPLSAGWADLGTWQSLWQHSPQTPEGNVISGDVTVHASSHNYLHGSGRMMVVAGVENLVVVDTDDALFIASSDHADYARQIAQTLAEKNQPQAFQHTYEKRPWGHFQSVDHGEHFKVKRITVSPGAKLSLQRHEHRAEHWVVISGKALVTCDDRQFELTPNESSYIPMGAVHRLENIGTELLEIIEVQTGKICDEADIVRFEDDYQRVEKAAKPGAKR